jgi:hypothetical protein
VYGVPYVQSDEGVTRGLDLEEEEEEEEALCFITRPGHTKNPGETKSIQTQCTHLKREWPPTEPYVRATAEAEASGALILISKGSDFPRFSMQNFRECR